ncbi:hypothetical protein BV394_01120 [Brevirhabdus pacifica]|uniref:L-ornithine N(alpha)-acyltransferase n=1 Tax=Brevirhabdus pacifica TaxID=1267768 RepID=A0A1U7DES1_9RHOB|nr:GNAT family N-acetyltransferase [Brevirhabdus pacifica]APX88497.1 hypothetical protein BV394_01120 [Brevirhabdus pacifica]OWU79799.1 hypothetical protein ATO5_01820 [Loktanella sp. 22II-4b]PJJ87023.1 ornithine-acyl[acyl carrier protein] N-acyltransferase [Brevirhabdus pacifica]
MPASGRPRYRARFADGDRDLEAARRLRAEAFFPADPVAAMAEAAAADDYDARCLHVLVEEVATGRLVCCFRALLLESGAGIEGSYAAGFYGLERLRAFPAPMIELGRFCIRPGLGDPDILRVAWAELTRLVDRHGVEMLFGCSSFSGTDPAAHAGAFALLRDRHLGPDRWRPAMKAPRVVDFATLGADGAGSGLAGGSGSEEGPGGRMRAMAGMPGLLRTYLVMGGWVSDHAVVDAQMNTLHVFTGVELSRVPAARARRLRADAV